MLQTAEGISESSEREGFAGRDRGTIRDIEARREPTTRTDEGARISDGARDATESARDANEGAKSLTKMTARVEDSNLRLAGVATTTRSETRQATDRHALDVRRTYDDTTGERRAPEGLVSATVRWTDSAPKLTLSESEP